MLFNNMINKQFSQVKEEMDDLWVDIKNIVA